MEQIRVLEIFGEPILNGGQETFVINFIRHMDRKNVAIDLLTPYECNNLILDEMRLNVISWEFPFKQGHFNLKIFMKLIQFLKNNPYQIVHIHSGSTLALMLISLAAKINHVGKIIAHSHSGMEKETLKHRIIKLCSYPFISSCPTDYCACSIEAGKAKFPKKVVRDKLKIVKNGIDIGKYSFDDLTRSRIRKLCHISDNVFLIGHVGRFTYEKNHMFLLEIFKQVKKADQNTKLMLVGEGLLQEQVCQKIKELNLQNDVILCGAISNVHEVMQAMDFFVLPSLFEGLPLVGVEAQAAGLTVIVSDKVSKDLQITGLLSYMSLEDSSDKWAEEILKQKCTERADFHKEIISAGYSIEQTANIIGKLYQEL